MSYTKQKVWTKESVFGLSAAVIPLGGFILFNILPLVIIFLTMFSDMDGLNFASLTWNNFANFSEVLNDADFWLSLANSFKYTLAHMMGLLTSLIISGMLTQNIRGTKVFRALFFIPYICSSVAVAVMWKWMFNESFGIINSILNTMGVESVRWFTDASSYSAMLLIVMFWQAPGYGIVMYNAAFSSVNRSLYEAAEIDGASAFRRFIHITLPAVSPTTYFLLSAGIIAGLQTFDIPMVFVGDTWSGAAGPNNAGLTTILYIYNKGIMFNNMPVASVMSFFIFIVITIIMIINRYLSSKWVSYD